MNFIFPRTEGGQRVEVTLVWIFLLQIRPDFRSTYVTIIYTNFDRTRTGTFESPPKLLSMEGNHQIHADRDL